MTTNFLHYRLQLDGDDTVRVRLDKQANVRLLDPQNFLSLSERPSPSVLRRSGDQDALADSGPPGR